MAAVSHYLYPRVCPILSLSSEDLTRCIEAYGREECFNTLATLITENYDFPYVRACIPRTPAPSALGPPRPGGKPKPAASNSLLGGYRCTRIPTDSRIPGITLVMQDAVSRLDWELDTFMESHRMKAWVAIQGRTRKWADSRSPHTRLTNVSVLSKTLDAELQAGRRLDHEVLRDIAVSHGEAVPPTVELYLQTIEKLNPSSVSTITTTYGVGLAAMACFANKQLRCCYDLSSLTSPAAASLREFVVTTGRPLIEELNITADLVFIDAVPYATHDLRAYLGEDSSPQNLSYKGHIDRILNFVHSAVAGKSSRIALVMSLRESPTLPTVEPILLSLMMNENLDLVGALVSQKRDYAVYLMLVHTTSNLKDERWKKLLQSHYPELLLEEEPLRNSSRPESLRRSTQGEAWDVTCLNTVLAKFKSLPDDNTDRIALQGPRQVRGKLLFPCRTRRCTVVSETSNLESGNIVYVFGDPIEPPPPAMAASEEKTPAVVVESTTLDPLLSRMVAGIRENIDAKQD